MEIETLNRIKDDYNAELDENDQDSMFLQLKAEIRE